MPLAKMLLTVSKREEPRPIAQALAASSRSLAVLPPPAHDAEDGPVPLLPVRAVLQDPVQDLAGRGSAFSARRMRPDGVHRRTRRCPAAHRGSRQENDVRLRRIQSG